MSFVEWVQAHRRSILFFLLALAAAGLVAAFKLPVTLFPNVSFPRVRVDLDAGDRPAKRMALQDTITEICAPFAAELYRGEDVCRVELLVEFADQTETLCHRFRLAGRERRLGIAVFDVVHDRDTLVDTRVTVHERRHLAAWIDG